jgi:hypothetical protein
VVVVAAGEAKEEEEDGKKGMLKKQAHGRLVWRRILFASKKIQSIIILNTPHRHLWYAHLVWSHPNLCMLISFGLIPTCVCSFPFRSIDVAAAHRGGGMQGPGARA